MNKNQSQLPLGKILAGMGISTILLSIGLFFFITTSRSKPNVVVTNDSAPGEVEESGLGPVDLSGPPPADENVVLNDPPREKAEASIHDPYVPSPAPPSDEGNEMLEPGSGSASTAVDTTEPNPMAEPKKGAIGISPSAHAEWEKMMGLQATLEGVVQTENKSSSGKTYYLYFSSNRDDAMVYMLTREVDDALTLDFLAGLRGKRVRVTGTVERQFGTNRLGVKIKSSSQIKVVID